MSLRTALLTIGLLVGHAAPSLAQEHEDHREAGHHVHGALAVVAAVEGDKVSVEMETPLWNLVGFEHEPTSGAEKRAWAEVTAQLGEADRIVSFPPAASCVAGAHELGPFSGSDAHSHSDHDGHELHDAVLSWTFTCSAPEAINAVTFEFFTSFPRIEQADAILFTDEGQAASVLTPRSRSLRLR